MKHTDELLRIGWAWLNANASSRIGLCSDRSCVRCRLVDILGEIELLQNTASNSGYVKCPKCKTEEVENIGDGSFGCLICGEHFS